ncbi:MAG: DUF2236 domain-containing protein [Solirubrobacteraceae bacterium]|nr:DUF2236 domain-containing protein [Solirubrobacteraceae bacterium]
MHDGSHTDGRTTPDGAVDDDVAPAAGRADAGADRPSADPLIPDPADAALYAPGRGSLVWTHGSDVRVMAASVYALLLQVSHPTVGAGVAEHSTFLTDPWGRLLRTLDYATTIGNGRPEHAAAMGRKIRVSHKRIKGVGPDGTRYHALEPEAYAWVHLTLGEGMIQAHRHMGRRLSAAQEEALWHDWRKAGRLLGIRDRDLPETWAEAQVLRDRMVAERLGHNEAVDQVLTLLRGPAPPSRRIPRPLWRLVSAPAGELMLIVTGGLMDPDLRSRLGIPWGPARQRAFRVVGALGRAASLPMMLTPPLRSAGPWYLWLRGRTTRSRAVDRVALDIETPGSSRP